MARVTRSTAQKQMDFTDDDAVPQESVLHVAQSPRTSRATVREVLGEITPNPEENTIPAPQKDPVDVELKGLKAAFRTAIGIKKKKKPKKPKNLEGSPADETLDNLATANPNAMAPGLIEPHYLQQYSGGADVTTLNDNNVQHTALPADTIRMTRQQLAKQQSGQFEQDVSFQDGYSGFYPEAYHDPRSVSAQFISNLTDSQFEIYRTLEMANHSMNLADGLRREIEGIISIPEVKAHLKQQPQIDVTSMLVERNVKMLSPVDDKAPTATFQVSAKAAEVQNSSDKAVDSDEDSFAQVITSRSPAKPVSRVDYVDELDKIEDVMDALDEATSPNVKATSPGKIAILGGQHGSSHAGEHLSRIFSPTDAELAKLRTLKIGNTSAQETSVFGNIEKETVTKDDCYSSLRVKSKDGLLQPHSTLRKVKSMHFETNSRASSQSTQDLSRPSSRAAESKRPVTAPTAQNTHDISRSSSKATETRRPVANKRPTSFVPPKQPIKSTKPATRPTFELPGEAVSRKLKEQREARRAQRESEDVESQAGSVASRVRSTKAPTKSTFELPGEAISRRKREAHEARLKQQEEEEKKRRQFKAKPSRCSFIVNGGVRETAASRARQSMHVPNNTQGNTDTGKPDGLNVSKRGSTISSGPTRRPALTSHESSSARIPAAPLSHRNLTPHASVVGTARPATTSTSMTGLSTQRSTSIRKTSTNQRGKEVYQRQERAIAEMQREKREKEEAAKRSRELAAERGRQASREWAEKQKAKAKKDVGMGPGFGPGGQMGLKS